MKNIYLFTLTIIAGLALAGSAHAALLVYEGFDYTTVGDDLIGKGGTTETGLSGTWADAETGGGDNMFLKSGSLNFSNLQTSGNHIGFESNSNNDIYNRGLSTTGFTGSSIYFSFLFEKLQNNFGADKEGFALMNGILPAGRFDGSNNPGASVRHGFAVAAVDGSNLQAIAYDGTTGTRVVSAAADSVPITVVNGGTNTSTSNQEVSMILGEISFGTGTGGADVFNLYNVLDDGSLDVNDLSLVATIEADVDESLISTLNLTRQVNVNYDEVRIGTTLDDVLIIPEPSSFTLILLALGTLFILRRRPA